MSCQNTGKLEQTLSKLPENKYTYLGNFKYITRGVNSSAEPVPDAYKAYATPPAP